jgi:DNA adenine methylase
MNKSFLKWAGNKYRVLSHLLPEIQFPEQFIEPFAGSLSVALNVTAQSYVLNDYNEDLIHLHQLVVSEQNFIDECELFFRNQNTEEQYYNRRTQFNESQDSKERAMLFVYLNRHCFNGLTRYNRSNQFNVPYGKYKSPYFPRKEMENFRNTFKNENVSFYSGDFANSELYSNVTNNTVVYFDPPYLPLTDTANFSDYASAGFSYENHETLRDLALELQSKGVKVIMSNHDTPLVRELYASASDIRSIDVGRFISAKGTSRNPVKEVIAVWN